ncbi:MAG TPA: putative 2-aminoethylphosphonate ABC transporter ATP-binding protein [Vineibacter sp.]|nr:putative 2-aminoethylphosphonate ABC transporter ATP-binding protein [Vineibacter sp.]
MSGNGTYLTVERVSKAFGAFTALREVSLEINRGEFVCFLGPSGCGKTTLLRAIAGLDPQTSGTIRQGDRDVSALPPSERDFGIVFQSYALFPNLTIFDNVAYGLRSRRQPRAGITARVKELLDLVGLAEQVSKYPAQLSGGQQQRVALARALATSPGLLLLDEPLSALDARVRAHLRHEIRALQRRLGVTTIMVTHDQEEALSMADRIVVMNHGVIEQVGTPIDIYRKPASAFVADFVGAMNFLPATVAGDGRVTMGALSLACAAAQPMAAGAAIQVCVRPEDVQMRGIAADTPNIIEARLADMEFLGSFFRASMHPVAAEDLAIQGDFSINLVRDLGLAPGQTIRIALPPDRLIAFSRG